MKLFLLLLALPFQTAPPGPPVVTCAYHPQPAAPTQTYFTLTLAQDHQEIENQYITNAPVFARVLQYLNADIAHDAYLRLSGHPDSLAAIAASYPRQYGATGRSSILLVFPISPRQLRHGCTLTFDGTRLALGTHRFLFPTADLQATP